MNTYPGEIHPGEILREELMVPLGLSESEMMVALDAPREDTAALLAERGPVTEALARALATYFKMSIGFWIGLQAEYDTRMKKGGRQ